MTGGAFSPALTRTQTRLGWAYFLFSLLVLPVLLKEGNLLLGLPMEGAELNFSGYTVNFLAVCLIFHRYLTECIAWSFRHFGVFLRALVLGLAAYYGLTWAVTQGILCLRPDFVNANNNAILLMGQDKQLMTAIGTVLLAPLAEECFFRGLLFQGLRSRGRLPAYVLSVLAFAAVHVIGYIGRYSSLELALCFVQYLPAGLCLAWACDHSGGLTAPLVIHALVNLYSTVTLF